MRAKHPMCGLVILVMAILAGTSCATLQSIAALRKVDFAIDRVANASLAGVPIDRVRDYQELSVLEVANIARALSRGDLPLDFVIHVSALNPADNTVSARLVQMDWTLLLEDRETISGSILREILLEPGVPGDIPVDISLDLADFFQHNARDMVDLALAATGAGGQPTRIALRATPTIQTALGPIRYPEPITIVSGVVGAPSPLRLSGPPAAGYGLIQ